MSKPRPSPSVETFDALAQLRSSTRDLHARLDAGLAVAARDAGLPEYRAHLQLLWRWLAPMQDWLDAHGDGPQDPRLLSPCARMHWLQQDLAELEVAAPTPSGRPTWPMPASAAFRWGACYVVEGSALGGRALLRALAPRLGGHQPRLLAGGGAREQAERWQHFLSAFRREVATPEALVESCAGARFAFARILQLAGLQHESRAQLAGATA